MLLSYGYRYDLEKVYAMSTSHVLSVRVSPQEHVLLQAAAAHAHSSVSDFVRRNTLQAATSLITGRNVITLTQSAWEDLEAQLAAPPQRHEALVSIMNKKPAWEN